MKHILEGAERLLTRGTLSKEGRRELSDILCQVRAMMALKYDDSSSSSYDSSSEILVHSFCQETHIDIYDPQQSYEDDLAYLKQGLGDIKKELASGVEPIGTELWERVMNYVKNTRSFLGLEPFSFPPSTPITTSEFAAKFSQQNEVIPNYIYFAPPNYFDALFYEFSREESIYDSLRKQYIDILPLFLPSEKIEHVIDIPEDENYIIAPVVESLTLEAMLGLVISNEPLGLVSWDD